MDQSMQPPIGCWQVMLAKISPENAGVLTAAPQSIEM
jgi:hypothetical protein